jgi:hypothetical protein
MSKLIRRLRWLLGYKPRSISAELPDYFYGAPRECVEVVDQIPYHGTVGWRFLYSDGSLEWVSIPRKVTR